MEHSKHVLRIFILLLFVLAGVLFFRGFMVPKSFGIFGHYRADSLKEQADKPVIHGGINACADCHEEITEALEQGSHQSVNCESCHAPLSAHIKDEEKIGDMAINKKSEMCLVCHLKLVSRPISFPQIEVEKHLREQGGEETEDACFECHQAHSPL